MSHECGRSCLGPNFIGRMRRALAGPRWTLPDGLTREEIVQYISDCADGKIPPDGEHEPPLAPEGYFERLIEMMKRLPVLDDDPTFEDPEPFF